MVRRVVGVLVEVGKGNLQPAAVPDLLTGHSDLPARLTAPASGLFLERVFYEPPPDDWPIEPALARLGGPKT
jgi:tRNA pseudouridine38-40 synthase